MPMRPRQLPKLQVFSVMVFGLSFAFCQASRPPMPSAKAPHPISDAMATSPSINDAGDAPTLAIDKLDEGGAATPIDPVVQAAIDAGKMPGCIVLYGRHDEILFQRAYGSRALVPERLPMTTDTVFDLASLTKTVATAKSIMSLVDRGKVGGKARG